MSEFITCPAPVEMLRTGSVCRITEDYDIWRAGQQVVFLRVCINEAIVAVPDEDDVYHLLIPFHLLEMDLTDATGRTHAVWWVAAMLGEPTIPPPTLIRARDPRPIWELVYFPPSTDFPPGRCTFHRAFAGQSYEGSWVSDDDVIAALATLDPTDDTRLPDGSRVVDARALEVLVRHMLAEHEGGAS